MRLIESWNSLGWHLIEIMTDFELAQNNTKKTRDALIKAKVEAIEMTLKDKFRKGARG